MPPHATPPKVRACSPPLPASLPPCTTPGTHAASATRTQPVAALGGTLAGALLRRPPPARLSGRRVCDRGGRRPPPGTGDIERGPYCPPPRPYRRCCGSYGSTH